MFYALIFPSQIIVFFAMLFVLRSNAVKKGINSPKKLFTMKSYSIKSLQKSAINVLLSSSFGFTLANTRTNHKIIRTNSMSALAVDIPTTSTVDYNKLSNEVIKKPIDKRVYKALTLENGLRVLLISDKETFQAAAAMDVHVGSFSDPNELPGLAHFCEHMSFLGTSKYPEEGEFSAFLSSHGGSSNAYTSSEDTVYYFDINNAYFQESLDRFAQFFIQPTFTESATARELNAIDSEHAKNINNNGFRIYQLEKDLANPLHPLNRFSTGNKETLESIPKSRGIDVRSALLAFHSKYYSSNQMTLAVIANEDISTLETLAKSLFSSIPNRFSPNPALAYWGQVSPFAPQAAAVALEVVPLDDTRRLSISWPVWITSPEQRKELLTTKYEEILAQLLGHEGKGSLRSFLVTEKSWANGLNAGASNDITDLEEFEVSVSLTEEGVKHRYEVIDAVFGYMDLLKSQTIPDYIYDEIAELSVIRFNFSETAEPSDYVSNIASNMQTFDSPSQYLTGSRIYVKPEESLSTRNARLMRYMNYLTPSQAKLTVISRSFEGKTKDVAKYYGTNYNYFTLEKETSRWAKIKHSDFPSLSIPQPNIFIPKNFSLLSNPIISDDEQERSKALDIPPTVIRNDDKWTVYHKLDRVFQQPKVYAIVTLAVDSEKYGPAFIVAAKLFISGFLESLNEYTYDARLSGMSASIELTSKGLQFKFMGFNDKLALFTESILHALQNFQPDERVFNRNKDVMLQEFLKFKTRQPYSHCDHFASLATETLQFPIDVMKIAVEKCTVASLNNFLGSTLSSSFGTALVIGNIDSQEALGIIDKIDNTFKFSPLAKEKQSRKQIVLIPSKLEAPAALTPTSTDGYLISRPEPNENDKNSAAIFYFQIATKDTKSQVLTELLGCALEQLFYNSLRTKQQLGYIVQSGVRTRVGYDSLVFTVQSAIATGPELINRVETFIQSEGLPNLLAMSQKKLDEYREGLITTKLEPDRRLTSHAGRFWSEINLVSPLDAGWSTVGPVPDHHDKPVLGEGTGPIFDRDQREVKALELITLEEFVEFAKDVLSRDGSMRRLLVSEVTSQIKENPKKKTKTFDTTVVGSGSDKVAVFKDKATGLALEEINNELSFREKLNLI